ncbi:hypothetical protein GF326_05705 [Candidatus Bathyarchaeota archaeon]|nr:hypothetical protein [Candidatus Bathyarchaeota archaeon]
MRLPLIRHPALTSRNKGATETTPSYEGEKATPVIRVGENRQDQICYALGIGAKGIIVPMINTKEEAINMVQWCLYPPEGVRSSAGMRGEWGDSRTTANTWTPSTRSYQSSP